MGRRKENISKVNYHKAKVCFGHSQKMGYRLMFRVYFILKLLLYPSPFTTTLKVPGNPGFFRQRFKDHHAPQEGCFPARSSAQPGKPLVQFHRCSLLPGPYLSLCHLHIWVHYFYLCILLELTSPRIKFRLLITLITYKILRRNTGKVLLLDLSLRCSWVIRLVLWTIPGIGEMS